MNMSAATRRGCTLICLSLTVLAATWLRVPGLTTQGTFTDEGFRISMAQPIARGQSIYRDVAGSGPPGAILFNAAILALIEESVVSIRVSYLIISLLSLCALFAVAYIMSGLTAALIAGALVATSPWDVYYSYHAMTEPPTVLLSLLAVLAIISHSERISLWRFCLAGIFGALSVMVKQPGVVVLLGIAIAELVLGIRNKTKRAALSNVTALGAGAASVVAVWSIWALAHDSWWLWFQAMAHYTSLSSSQLHHLLGVPGNGDVEKWTSLFESYAARRLFIPIGIFALVALPAFRTCCRGETVEQTSSSTRKLQLIRILTIGFSLFTYLLPLSHNGGLSHYLLIAEPWWVLLASCLVAQVIHRIKAACCAKRWDLVAFLFLLFLVAAVCRVGPRQYQDLVKWRDANANPRRSLQWERHMSSRLASSRAPLIMTNPIYYFHLRKFPPVYPLQYDFMFDIVAINFLDPVRADELIATALSASDMLLVDPKRRSIIFGSLERSGFPIKIKLLFERDNLYIYSIHPGQGAQHMPQTRPPI